MQRLVGRAITVRLAGRAVDPCRPTSQGRDDRLIWRTRAPISMCGPADRMERSEPLAGVSRRPSAAPNVDPRTSVNGAVSESTSEQLLNRDG